MPKRSRIGNYSQAKLDLREEAQNYAKVALRTLVDVCRSGDKDASRVSAAKEILDRGYGRSIQPHHISGLDRADVGAITAKHSESEAAQLYEATLNYKKK